MVVATRLQFIVSVKHRIDHVLTLIKLVLVHILSPFIMIIIVLSSLFLSSCAFWSKMRYFYIDIDTITLHRRISTGLASFEPLTHTLLAGCMQQRPADQG